MLIAWLVNDLCLNVHFRPWQMFLEDLGGEQLLHLCSLPNFVAHYGQFKTACACSLPNFVHFSCQLFFWKYGQSRAASTLFYGQFCCTFWADENSSCLLNSITLHSLISFMCGLIQLTLVWF